MATLADVVTAIFAHDVHRVRALVSDEPQLVRTRPPTGPSALLAAAYARNADVIDIVRSHTDPDLFEAAALGDVDRVNAIVAEGAGSLNERSGDGWTALHLAAFFGHDAIVERLLAAGASHSIRSLGQEENHPLHAAIAGRESPAIVTALLDAGADANATAGGGYRPLHLAAARGNRVVVDLLMARGATLNTLTDDGHSASALAGERGFPDLATYLNIET